MSYPWGEKKDRMELEKILTDYNYYEFIFTTEEKFNYINTHHFQIGRFQQMQQQIYKSRVQEYFYLKNLQFYEQKCMTGLNSVFCYAISIFSKIKMYL